MNIVGTVAVNLPLGSMTICSCLIQFRTDKAIRHKIKLL